MVYVVIFMIKVCILKIIDSFKRVFQDKYAQICMISFSLLFGFVKSLSEYVGPSFKIYVDIRCVIFYAEMCYLALVFAYWIISQNYNIKPVKIKYPKTLCLIFFGIFLAVYGVCWLNYWPGAMFIDNIWMIVFYHSF